MDAQRRQDFLPELKELKNDLEQFYNKPYFNLSNSTSSDNMDDFEESSSEVKKNDRNDQDSRTQQHLILRKRDVKGNYKAKFNIEKLMIEHEKKKVTIKNIKDQYNQLLDKLGVIDPTENYSSKKDTIDELTNKKEEIQEQLNELRQNIGKKIQSVEQLNAKAQSSKSHWDFLVKEMKWMAEDFEREHKKKIGDSKKQSRACKKQIHEKKLKKEKQLKDQKIELRRKAQNMSRMVQSYWKSVEKVVKHNYNVLYEKKRQQIRTKKLESFVSKHLKLSVRVAEELNTKSFIEQSMAKDDGQGQILQKRGHDHGENQTVLKVYGTQDEFENQKQIQKFNDGQTNQDLQPYKRQRITVTVVKDKDGLYDVDEEFEKQQIMHSQVLSQQNEDGNKQLSRTLIAEQTVQMAQSFQPTGTTLSSVNVKTKVPFLLNGSLREYQIIGLDWLVTLHNKKLNGILADEMGLGKTIQTIAMLASLACDKGVWGPHLIVVPTTIIINWEMEFKKWCPAFKILTYFGSQKERKMKRHGWSKENSFHVCITSYKLVIQDHFAFRRKKWYYMILDEAQNIKNFKSQRWQTLLRFNTKRRLLLTGTPLQNDVMELWSLMHFLMPNIFSSQQDFKEWFSNPFNQSINQNQTLNISVVQKLQSILRPFLLRRMKRDVEKQLPEKVEHIVQCNLSRRQRLLYDEYINSDKTKQTLNDSDFFSIMNILMQLRKVCNHPDLFEARTIESPFIMQSRISFPFSSMIYKALQYNPLKDINMKSMNFILSEFDNMTHQEYQRMQELYPKRPLVQVIGENKNHLEDLSEHLKQTRPLSDWQAVGKKLPVNCNVFAKSNTRQLQQNLPSVLPYESNIYHEVPSYLNSACLPFAQHYYSLNSYDQVRFSQRNKEYCEYDVYMSSLKDEEQKLNLVRFAQKLIQWRQIDHTNRVNLIFKKPIYGEDCRKAMRCNLLFGDVFDVKRHRNLDKYSKLSNNYINDLMKAPSAVFNPFATTQEMLYNPNQEPHYINIVEDWPEQDEDQIENIYMSTFSLIKEVPMTLQIRNKKKKQQLKQLQLEQKKLLEQQLIQQNLQQQLLQRQQSQLIEERIEYQEQLISIIIDMKNAKENINEEMNEDGQNKNVEVKIEDITKERIEYKQIELQPEPMEIVDLQSKLLPPSNVINDQDKESPYQRIYQNASKRFKKDVVENKETESSEEQKLLNGDQVMQDQTQGGQNEQQQQENQTTQENEMNNSQPKEENKVSSQEQNPENQQHIVKEYIPNQPQVEEQQQSQQNPPASQDTKQDRNNFHITYRNCEVLRDLIVTPLQRVQILEDTIKHFKFLIPKCVSKPPEFIPTQIVTQHEKEKAYERFAYQKLMSHRNVNQSLKYSNILFFPHRNLIQYDCGKLQRLATLLKNLHSKGHKVLIFTQMTRILDILENFLNLHGYTYVRLDGSVKVEMRQRLVDKFNLNKKIFCFISSTRCGGIGINLTGADCVIFYDTDWNPAMDKQAQDRCHRIGQTKTVHIYRLISINTIEENIFKKSLQKRDFGGLIIEGSFDMEIFKKVSLKDILEDDTLFKPKRRDLLKEENIVFHTNTAQIGSIDDLVNNAGEAVNELDFEKQKEIEQYRKRFEEALVRIEDKEDVIALQQAKREIDDEFDEDNIPVDGGEKSDQNVDPSSAAAQTEVTDKQGEEAAADLDKRTANSLSKDMKKSEFINWRTHPTLNDVTKMCIEYYEKNYTFDTYLDDRSKKDNKFVNPLTNDEEKEDAQEENNNEESEFSLSDEDEEMSQNEEEPVGGFWDRFNAEQQYKRTKEEIESKYFVI